MRKAPASRGLTLLGHWDGSDYEIFTAVPALASP
jgi:hypothetical protein